VRLDVRNVSMGFGFAEVSDLGSCLLSELLVDARLKLHKLLNGWADRTEGWPKIAAAKGVLITITWLRSNGNLSGGIGCRAFNPAFALRVHCLPFARSDIGVGHRDSCLCGPPGKLR